MFEQPLLGKNLRKYRLAKKLYQPELAAASGVSVPTISRLENGATDATIGTLNRLSHALGIDVMALGKPGSR